MNEINSAAMQSLTCKFLEHCRVQRDSFLEEFFYSVLFFSDYEEDGVEVPSVTVELSMLGTDKPEAIVTVLLDQDCPVIRERIAEFCRVVNDPEGFNWWKVEFRVFVLSPPKLNSPATNPPTAQPHS